MPWKRSSSPKSVLGKFVASQNACEYGSRGSTAQKLEKLLALLNRDRVAVDEGLKKWDE